MNTFTLQPGDILRLKAPTGTRYNIWRVTAVNIGELGQESLVEIETLSCDPGRTCYKTYGSSVVPLVMIEALPNLTVVRTGHTVTPPSATPQSHDNSLSNIQHVQVANPLNRPQPL